MDLKALLQRALADEKIKALKGYFLASVFSVIDRGSEYTLLFYSEKTKSVVDVMVGSSVVVGHETPALKEMEMLDLGELEVDIGGALRTAKENFRKPVINILATLHMVNGKLTWTIAMIAADFSATSFDVDAKTGKILKEETTSLIRREK